MNLDAVSLDHRLVLNSETPLYTIADNHNIFPRQVRKLEASFEGKDLGLILMLLEGRKYKAKFILSIRDQLVAWLKDPNPQYDRPLSKYQRRAILAAMEERAAGRHSALATSMFGLQVGAIPPRKYDIPKKMAA